MPIEEVERELFTIGHSNHLWPVFLSLLKQHDITTVADVRSQPISRLPQFRRAALERRLSEAGITYLFVGRELGARRDEPQCYVNGAVNYEQVAGLPLFRAGVERILQAADAHRIALMCAEKEPLDCHRTILICRQLRTRPIAIWHILATGQLEEHTATERRLMRLTDVGPTLLEPDLADADLLQRAYEHRGRAIAYRAPSQAAAR